MPKSSGGILKASQAKSGVSPYAEHIAQLIAKAPPLTAGQQAKLRGLIR